MDTEEIIAQNIHGHTSKHVSQCVKEISVASSSKLIDNVDTFTKKQFFDNLEDLVSNLSLWQ